MTTREKKSETMRLMERITGGPLTIGKILWALRKCDEIPQTTFARKLGISKQHLCDIEKGRKFVTPARAALFAKKLGHPPAYFIQIALEEDLRHIGLKLSIKVEAA